MTLQLKEASDAVIAAYGEFTAPTEEGQQQLAKIRDNLKAWFDSPSRLITEAAASGIEKMTMAVTKIDHASPHEQGFTYLERLGARHRPAASRMDQDSLTKLRRLISTHILCGYLFAEFVNETNRQTEPQISSEKLYEMWVSTIYPPVFNLDARSKDESDVKTIWFGSVGQKLRDHLVSHGADWQDLEMQILTHYFNGGMLLRMLEGRPLTDEELLNISIGGSISKKTPPPGWPTLNEEELSVFTVEERAFLEHAQLQLIEDSKKELDEINSTCTIRPQYAKTYRVLRRSKRETLEKMRCNISKSRPGTSQAFEEAMIRTFDRIISHKHSQMALFFKGKWGEDIENWAGKEGSFPDRAGCIFFLGSVAIVLAFFLLFA